MNYEEIRQYYNITREEEKNSYFDYFYTFSLLYEDIIKKLNLENNQDLRLKLSKIFHKTHTIMEEISYKKLIKIVLNYFQVTDIYNLYKLLIILTEEITLYGMEKTIINCIKKPNIKSIANLIVMDYNNSFFEEDLAELLNIIYWNLFYNDKYHNEYINNEVKEYIERHKEYTGTCINPVLL